MAVYAAIWSPQHGVTVDPRPRVWSPDSTPGTLNHSTNDGAVSLVVGYHRTTQKAEQLVTAWVRANAPESPGSN